jgi:mono/diheme cytochrome c family protein
VIAKGVPHSAMPPFAQNAGGTLTDRQIVILAEQMQSRWSRPQDFAGVPLPPYSAGLGDLDRGATAFRT